MPINAFGGGPGSGKTYGVLEHVILPALADGRFIITNIEGLNESAIYEYVVENFYKGKIFCIGHIRHCSRSAPDDDDFFPGEHALDKPVPVPTPDYGRVVGGDLVVIDEATRYWNGDAKVKKQHAYFFREHRHFANEMGHTCDMVVIDPDLTMLARALKGKIELASVTHKPKEIGMNRYVVRLYRGVRLNSKPTSTEGPYKFKEKIYTLYKSYSHANAKEKAIDKRQNLFNNPRLWIYAGCLLLLLVVCIYGLVWFYRVQVEKHGGNKSAEAKPVASAQPGAPTASNGAPESSPAGSSKSESLRIAGEAVVNGERWIVIADSNGGFRLEHPSAFVGRGMTLVGNVEGKRVATWTGGAIKQQSIVGNAK
jgi:zona occludens toxin